MVLNDQYAFSFQKIDKHGFMFNYVAATAKNKAQIRAVLKLIIRSLTFLSFSCWLFHSFLWKISYLEWDSELKNRVCLKLVCWAYFPVCSRPKAQMFGEFSHFTRMLFSILSTNHYRVNCWALALYSHKYLILG